MEHTYTKSIEDYYSSGKVWNEHATDGSALDFKNIQNLQKQIEDIRSKIIVSARFFLMRFVMDNLAKKGPSGTEDTYTVLFHEKEYEFKKVTIGYAKGNKVMDELNDYISLLSDIAAENTTERKNKWKRRFNALMLRGRYVSGNGHERSLEREDCFEIAYALRWTPELLDDFLLRVRESDALDYLSSHDLVHRFFLHPNIQGKYGEAVDFLNEYRKNTEGIRKGPKI